MPVQKFRSIEAMKATPPPDRGISLQKRIAGILARSAALLPPFERPKGVFKFRTIEEMQAQRDAWERERAQAGLARRREPSGGS
jgi:hypothetical protein